MGPFGGCTSSVGAGDMAFAAIVRTQVGCEVVRRIRVPGVRMHASSSTTRANDAGRYAAVTSTPTDHIQHGQQPLPLDDFGAHPRTFFIVYYYKFLNACYGIYRVRDHIRLSDDTTDGNEQRISRQGSDWRRSRFCLTTIRYHLKW